MADYRESGSFFRQGKVDTEQLARSNRILMREEFGIAVEVPEPPQDFLKTMEVLHNEGISKIKPFGVPNIINFFKPNPWFFRQITNGRLSEDAAVLKAGWHLIDTCRKPDLQKGKQRYEDDYLGPTMQKLRKEGKIYTFRNLPEDSRLGASTREIQQLIIPEFVVSLSIPQPRRMRAIEFNVWGNMSHPEWGDTDSWELFEDELKGSVGPQGQSAGPLVLIGGSSKRGGLSHIDFGWPEHRHPDAGFRLVIPFPQKP